MKFIFITLVLAVHAHASDLNTRFPEATKLVEGQYEMVRGIGLENSVTRERDCTTTVTGQFQGQKISGLVQDTCAKLGSAKTEVEVIINDHEITYTR